MKNNNKTFKAVVLSLVLAMGMLLPANVFAQDTKTGGGLFGFGKIFGFDGQLFGENLNEELTEEEGFSPETGGGLFGFGKLFGFDGFMYGENLNEEPIEVEGFSTETGGGLFGFGKGFESDSRLFGNRGAINDNITGGITNVSFGQEVPLGGGIAIMLVAGLGYVALKKKEDKQ